MWTVGRWKRKQKVSQREKELQDLLVKYAENVRSSNEARIAIEYCKHLTFEYADLFDFNEARWNFWQGVVVIGGVIATLSGVITLPALWLTGISNDPSSLSWLRGVPAAIDTIAAGYLSSFTYRDDAVRHEVTAQILWNELAKFLTRAAPYNQKEDEDVSAFMAKICNIVEAESRDWSALVKGNTTPPTTPAPLPRQPDRP
jgi:hypothetical protein